MNSRLLKTVVLAGIIAGGIWMLSKRDKIRQPSDVVELVKQQFSTVPAGFPSLEMPASVDPAGDAMAQTAEPQFVTNVIRIASFHLNPGISSASTTQSMETLIEICRRYDVVVLQSIGAGGNEWLVNLTAQINRKSGSDLSATTTAIQNPTEFSFISEGMDSRLRLNGAETHAAILFNRRTVQLDQSQWYAINDPDQLLSHAPLVACLRARGPSAHQAFTFTLVNVKFGAHRRDSELEYLDDLFRAIREDGRGEDDVLIVGDFRASDRETQPIRNQTGMTWMASSRPTNIAQFDNLIFNPSATVEFTGRGGEFDFMRSYNLRLEESLRVSEHMPVWAEFSVLEGDLPIQTRVPVPSIKRHVADGRLSSDR